MRRWAMAASAASPPASWRAWRRSASPPMATASATSTACSGRASTTAGRSSSPRTGWPSAIPGSSSARKSPIEVGFGGRVEASERRRLGQRIVWQPAETRAGRRLRHAGRRLARASTSTRCACGRRGRVDPIRLDAFNRGDHIGALVPNRPRPRASPACSIRPTPRRPGQELRLRQEYFFTSASLQDSCAVTCSSIGDHRNPCRQGGDPAQRHASGDRRRRADAHPGRRARHAPGRRPGRSPAATISYTNHTLLPEALESWPVPLMERLLPRHMQIIYAINANVLAEARKPAPTTPRSPGAVSLIDERMARRVRMGHLAFLGSHKVNGVSALHTELMKETVFRDLQRALSRPHHQQDQRHHPARWLLQCQSGPDRAAQRGDRRPAARRCRHARQGARAVRRRCRVPGPLRRGQAGEQGAARERRSRSALGVPRRSAALFDVQIKRIHEYKRQLLNILEAIALYDAIRAHPRPATGCRG